MAETENKWESITLGQNKTIQDIAAAAAKASELLEINVKLASTTLKAAGVFLLALLNPYIALLKVVADLIDDYVKDFKNIGFYVLEVSDPSGKSTIPVDKDNKAISLVMGSAGIIANRAVAITMNQTEEFYKWTKETLDISDFALTGPLKGEYRIAVGMADKNGDGQNDNRVSTYNSQLNMYTMTPSIVIATMIAAMDDELDLRRPQFSSSAEAGAIVMIIGISDLTKNLATLKDTLDAFIFFFGGEERKDAKGNPIPSGGILSAIEKLRTLMLASLGQLQEPNLNNVTIKVNNVCGVRGTEDDKERLGNVLSTTYPNGKPYNYEKQFEVGDYVVGPRVKLGARCMGYVSKIDAEKTLQDENTTDKYGKNPFYSQELTITGLTDFDKIGWENLSSGAKISRVAWKKKYTYSTTSSRG